MLEAFSNMNKQVNAVLWGSIMQAVFLGVGLYFSISCGWLPITKWKVWLKYTLLSCFSKEEGKKEEHSISQFQSICTTLAATIGTGNIVGVATALTFGGPGAIFWMWLSSILGMMTTYGENVLGIKYRYKDKNGAFIGGPMAYMEKGIKKKWMAIVFAGCCVFSSLGMGNMAQANSVASAISSTFSFSPKIIGIILSGIVGMIMIGGIKRIGKVAEMVVPFMAGIFFLGSFAVLIKRAEYIPSAFCDIVVMAVNPKASIAGVLSYTVMVSMRLGIARGIFTNEAGLGSSVVINSNSAVKEPVIQGMWGIFAVFADTIVMCTITALVILVSGVYDIDVYNAALHTPIFEQLPNGVVLTSAAFSSVLGSYGQYFVTISMLFFGFATLLAWAYCGEQCVKYMFGEKAIGVYQFIFLICIFLGCMLRLDIVWELCDTFNGLMAIPNLIAIVLLGKEVKEETKKFFQKQGK